VEEKETHLMPQRSGERETGWQLPSSLDTLIAADHAVRFVAAYLDGLDATDWSHLGIDRNPKDRGAPRYHPTVLLGIWLWGFMQGVRSSRKLEAACVEVLSYRWLSGQQTPDHNTLWRFYQAHRAGMRYLLTHSVQMAVRAGLVDLALQAIDGTKIAGTAAKDRTYDQPGLDHLIDRLEQAIADLEAQNTTGGEGAPPRLPQELASKEALLERVRQAKAELAPGERINLTDREARFMKGRGGYLVGYNAQAVVSPLQETVTGSSGMLITAADVSDEPDDHVQLLPLLEQAAATTGQRAAVTVADGGYHSGANLLATRTRRVVMPEANRRILDTPYHKDRFTYDAVQDTYTCPEGQTLTFRGTKLDGDAVYRGKGERCRICPAFGICTTDQRQGRSLRVSPAEFALRSHRVWMATAEAKDLYRRRKELVEPVFGILKEQQRARRFLLRGMAGVQAEWSLMATTFNLRTLARLWRQQPGLVSSGVVTP
jgi:transposase